MRSTVSLALAGLCLGLAAAPVQAASQSWSYSGTAADDGFVEGERAYSDAMTVKPGIEGNDGYGYDIAASEGEDMAAPDMAAPMMDDGTMAEPDDGSFAAMDEGAAPTAPEGSDNAYADAPYDAGAGHFTMTTVGNSVLRLDTVTGTVTVCKEKGEDWVCSLTADERAAYEDEVGRLMEENAELVKRVGELEASLARGDAPAAKKDGTAAPSSLLDAPLSDREEQELDRVLGMTEKAMRGFIGLAKTLKQEFKENDPAETAPKSNEAKKAPAAPADEAPKAE